MKPINIILIYIFIVLILTVSTASANENITSNEITQTDEGISLEIDEDSNNLTYLPLEGEVKNVSIEIPNKICCENYNYNMDDYPPEWYEDSAVIILPNDATGDVKITVNDTLYKSVNVKNAKHENYYLNDNGKVIYSYFKDLKCGIYDIGVIYSGNYGTVSKYETLNITYNFSIYYPYGQESLICDRTDMIFFSLPGDIKGNISVFIDGAKILYNINDVIPGTFRNPANYYDGSVFDFAPIRIKNLQIGRHTLTVKYSGDEKYPARTITDDFEVKTDPKFDSQYHVNSLCPITVNLGENITGNFSAYISEMNSENYTLIDCVNITNGSATIYYNCTKLGDYEIKTIYNTNYGSHESHAQITVSCIEFKDSDLTFYLNSNYPVALKLPEDALGNFSLYVSEDDDENYKLYKCVDIINGSATINFKTKKESYYWFEAVCNSNYGFEKKNEAAIFEDGSKITTSKAEVFYNDKEKYSIKLYGSDGKLVGKNTIVNVNIGKTHIKTKTNANGVATLTLPKLKPGTYTITAKYNNVKATKKLTVKHLINLKTVKVKKSAKKLTLQATLKNKKAIKGKTITFKFNGKTYKAKTNSKGIAKVTIKKSALKKLKAGKKVAYQATYLKDTVKKTAKVKK